MEKVKHYIALHLTVMLFTFTTVFSKFAAEAYNRGGIREPRVYIFLFLMLLNCAVYAVVWQKVIKHFELNVAYANRTVYVIWSQIWAVVIFHETLSLRNIIGMFIVLIGILVVIFNE